MVDRTVPSQLEDSLFDTIEKLGKSDRYSILESDFIDNILPLIKARGGEEEIDLRRWVETAGNPHAELNVIDDGSNEVIFVLPPVMARIGTLANLDPGHGSQINDAISMYGSLLANHDEVQAEALLFRELAPLIEPVNREYTLSFLRRWYPIYRRYNIDMSLLFGTKANELIPALDLPEITNKSSESPQTTKDNVSGPQGTNPSIGKVVDDFEI